MFIFRSKSCKNNEFIFCVRMTAIMMRSDHTRFLIRINHIPDHKDITSQGNITKNVIDLLFGYSFSDLSFWILFCVNVCVYITSIIIFTRSEICLPFSRFSDWLAGILP